MIDFNFSKSINNKQKWKILNFNARCFKNKIFIIYNYQSSVNGNLIYIEAVYCTFGIL